jgi:hypothetical protein
MERDGYNDDDGYMSDEELEAYDQQYEDDDEGEGEGEGEPPVSDARAYQAGYQSAAADARLDELEAKYPELQHEAMQELVVRDALEAARRQGGVPQSEMPRLIEQATLARRDPGDNIVNSMASGRFRLGE